jgi:hypothetical protein
VLVLLMREVFKYTVEVTSGDMIDITKFDDHRLRHLSNFKDICSTNLEAVVLVLVLLMEGNYRCTPLRWPHVA